MTLSPEARALFDEAREASERPDAGVPDDARRRMRAHVLAAAAAGGATAAATAAKAATAATAANAATAKATGAGVVGKTMMWLGSLSMGKVVLGFAAAAGLTLGGLTVVDSESTPAVPAPTSPSPDVAPIQPAPAPTTTAGTPLASDIANEDAETTPDEPEIAPAPRDATAPSATPETLEEQAALLMRARDAIRAGRHGEAQRLLDGYRERYGKGALGEEQEALTVLNLCGSDDPRGPEAAERFAARHPGSPLLQRIEQSCH